MTTHARHCIRKIPTAQSLDNIALYYLSRYAASEFSLRRVLENRLRRASRHHPEFACDDAAQDRLKAAIDTIIHKHKKTGALNDAAFAELKTAGFRRAGRSARAIQQRLARSGIASVLVKQALAKNADDEDTEAAELKAAMIFARRRKLGNFRAAETSFERKQKDLATMARAGFALDVARKVLGKNSGDPEEE
jgi:regulatory protein